MSQLVPRLQRLFGDISDIDLFLRGLMERPADDALLGPTFQCLVGDQFKRLKFGDRFWFEEGGQPNSFTEGEATTRDVVIQSTACCIKGPGREGGVTCLMLNIFRLLTAWARARRLTPHGKQSIERDGWMVI